MFERVELVLLVLFEPSYMGDAPISLASITGFGSQADILRNLFGSLI